MLDSVLEKLATAGKLERPPTMDGRKMVVLIMPNKSAAKPKPKPQEKPPEVKPKPPETKPAPAKDKVDTPQPG